LPVRNLLVDLIERGWDDAQGAPAAEYPAFHNAVLPDLVNVIDLTLAGNTTSLPGAVNALVVAYHSSMP
jgi:hypothetical protein